MHAQSLRHYERLGLVRPSRSRGRVRFYSRADIERLLRNFVSSGIPWLLTTTYPAFAARRFLPRPIRLRTAPSTICRTWTTASSLSRQASREISCRPTTPIFYPAGATVSISASLEPATMWGTQLSVSCSCYLPENPVTEQSVTDSAGIEHRACSGRGQANGARDT